MGALLSSDAFAIATDLIAKHLLQVTIFLGLVAPSHAQNVQSLLDRNSRASSRCLIRSLSDIFFLPFILGISDPSGRGPLALWCGGVLNEIDCVAILFLFKK